MGIEATAFAYFHFALYHIWRQEFDMHSVMHKALTTATTEHKIHYGKI